MVTIKEVAARAGVSISSVSRVLNKTSIVNPEIAEKVKKAAEELNYKPNKIAQSLRMKKTQSIGLIVADINNSFFAEMSKTIAAEARKYNYNLLLFNVDEDSAKEHQCLLDIVHHQISSVIIAPTEKIVKNNSLIKKYKLNFIVIDRRIKSGVCNQILLDNVGAAFELTEHLIQQGNRRIAAIIHDDSPTGPERLEGYKKALAANNIKYDSGICRLVKSKKKDGFNAAYDLFNETLKADALITSNPLLAAGAFEYLHQKNIQIPKDIAFASFDSATWMKLVTPTITSMTQPVSKIGEEAFRLALESIKNPKMASETITLRGLLTVRDSSKSLKYRN